MSRQRVTWPDIVIRQLNLWHAGHTLGAAPMPGNTFVMPTCVKPLPRDSLFGQVIALFHLESNVLTDQLDCLAYAPQ
jgi:hypothetical protein